MWVECAAGACLREVPGGIQNWKFVAAIQILCHTRLAQITCSLLHTHVRTLSSPLKSVLTGGTLVISIFWVVVPWSELEPKPCYSRFSLLPSRSRAARHVYHGAFASRSKAVAAANMYCVSASGTTSLLAAHLAGCWSRSPTSWRCLPGLAPPDHVCWTSS